MKKIIPLYFAFFLYTNCFCQRQETTITTTINQNSKIEPTYETSNDKNLTNFFTNFNPPILITFKNQSDDSVNIKIGEKKTCKFNIPPGTTTYRVEKKEDNSYKIIDKNSILINNCDGFAGGDLKIIKITYPTNEEYQLPNEKSDSSPASTSISFIDSTIASLLLKEYESSSIATVNSSNTFILNIRGSSLFDKKLKRISVGNFLNLNVINYHPYRDSVHVDIKFHDYFKDAENSFTELLKTQTGIATPKETQTTEDKTTQPDMSDKSRVETEKASTKALIEGFQKDLLSIYNKLYIKRVINLDSLSVILNHLDHQIAKHFIITVVTAATIETKGKELIKANVNENERENYEGLLTAGIAEYKKLNAYYHVITLPQQIQDKDYTELSIQLIRDGKTNTNTTFTLKNRWGWGFGYSVGFMGTKLRDFEYSLKQIATYRERKVENPDDMTAEIKIDTIYKDSIFRVDNGKFNIGAVALGHFYTRIPEIGVNIAASAGFGVNSQLDNHYFLGGSIMLGRKRQFVLSTGKVFAKVKRLEARYSEGELLPIIQGQTNVVQTREVWGKGCFFSATMQL